jgi:DNA-binding MarR family transcriptional regulator
MAEYGPDFDPTPLTLTLLLYRMIAVLDRATAVEHRPLGLSTSQFNVLTVLHRAHGAMTMGSLGRAVSVRPPNLTSVVNSLRARGLVDRESNPDDRRSSFVRITDEADAMLRAFLPGHWDFLDVIYGGLDRGGRERLVDLLSDVLLKAEDTPGDRQPEVAEHILDAAHHGWASSRVAPARLAGPPDATAASS